MNQLFNELQYRIIWLLFFELVTSLTLLPHSFFYIQLKKRLKKIYPTVCFLLAGILAVLCWATVILIVLSFIFLKAGAEKEFYFLGFFFVLLPTIVYLLYGLVYLGLTTIAFKGYHLLKSKKN